MKEKLFSQYKRLLAIAEAGLFYGKDAFDQERYAELKQIALELISETTDKSLSELTVLTEKAEGYPTPKIDVRGFICKEDQILLVEDRKTKEWSLPGGYAEVGLTAKENVIKEVLEETGFVVDTAELIAVFDTNLRKDIPQLFQYYKLVFKCHVKEGGFVENLETSNIGFFALDQLPLLSKNRTTKEQLTILLKESKLYVE